MLLFTGSAMIRRLISFLLLLTLLAASQKCGTKNRGYIPAYHYRAEPHEYHRHRA